MINNNFQNIDDYDTIILKSVKVRENPWLIFQNDISNYI